MEQIFSGRTALVTGGGGGIGAAIAHRLGTQGATVAVTDIQQAAAEQTAADIRAAGGQATAYALDVSSGHAVRSTVELINQQHGVITMAVTAAGVIDIYDFVDLPEVVWERTMNINLKGTFLVFQAVARQMLEANVTGGLVGIASVAGRGGRPNAVDYAASKAGVISVVRSAMLAFSPHGITINAVCPGVVDTPMTKKIHQERSRLSGLTPEASFEKMAATIPLGRTQTPDDVADVVAFLLSPQGSYITGQAINACGGQEMD